LSDLRRNAYLEEVRETIRTHGWMVQFVETDQRPSAYTIGLHDHAMPELLVTGLAAPEATGLLRDHSKSSRSTTPTRI
jgi:Domain of unknown function (DUF4262)